MKRNSAKITLALAVALLLMCCSIAPVWALPPLPCSFQGNVTLDAAAAPGATIEAKIGSTVVGGPVTATAGSTYFMLVAQDEVSGVPAEGATLTFYVNGFVGGSATWQSGEIKVLNLAATSGPAAPQITTAAASSISNNAATLNGSIDNLGGYTQVRVRFQYGTTTAYGTNTSWQTFSATANIHHAASSLAPLTQYHFRIQLETIAPSNSVTINGNDMTFTTLAGPPWPFVRNLDEGWVILSTPVALASTGNQVTEIMSSFSQAWQWTGTAWKQIGTASVNPTWTPLEAFYVKVPAGGATATFNPSTSINPAATRVLTSGKFALVGPSPAFNGAAFPASPVTDVLAGIHGNYINAVAPALGQNGWTYVPGAAVVPNVDAFGGIWVFVNTGANKTLVGFANTPLSSNP